MKGPLQKAALSGLAGGSGQGAGAGRAVRGDTLAVPWLLPLFSKCKVTLGHDQSRWLREEGKLSPPRASSLTQPCRVSSLLNWEQALAWELCSLWSGITQQAARPAPHQALLPPGYTLSPPCSPPSCADVQDGTGPRCASLQASAPRR